jgi:hypothetical protein
VIAIAPPTIGMFSAGPVEQRASAFGCSVSGFRCESDPAKSVCLLTKSVMPAPEPTPW